MALHRKVIVPKLITGSVAWKLLSFLELLDASLKALLQKLWEPLIEKAILSIM